MRILLLNWRDWSHPRAGGAELYLHEVAREWSLRGHEVTMFCGASDGLPDLELLEHMTVIRRGSRLGVYRAARQFCQTSVSGNFDIVIDSINTRPFFAHDYIKQTPVVGLAYQLAREVWFHETPLPVAMAGRYYLEPKWLRRYRNVPMLTISESSKRSLEQYGLDEIAVVPVGLARPDIELPAKEDRPTVLFCGRLASNKRPDEAIEAFARARAQLPDGAQMWVVGSGPLEERLRRQAPPDVRFFGRVTHEEKFALMARAHMLAVTSVREGWGMVVSEAASVGTPSVGYEVPGLCDSIRASGGVLVAQRPAALAATMTSLLPEWSSSGCATLRKDGGVRPWAEVAEAILREALRTTGSLASS